MSDERGTLVLRIKPFEDYEIRASREGFVPALEPPTIWPVVGETAVNILLAPGEPVPALPDGDSTAGRLPPKGMLTGRVVTVAGQPLRKAWVHFLSRSHHCDDHTLTNNQGQYRIALYRALISSEPRKTALLH